MRDGVDYLPLVRELQKVDYSLFAEPNNDTLSSKPEEQFVMKLYSAVPGGKYTANHKKGNSCSIRHFSWVE